MEAKDRVYQALCRMSKSDCQITAAALAEELNLSRQVVSHYLNRLLEEGSVEKTLTRPVCWNITVSYTHLDSDEGSGHCRTDHGRRDDE